MATAIHDSLYNGASLQQAPRHSLRIIKGGMPLTAPSNMADSSAALGVAPIPFNAPVKMTHTPGPSEPVASNVAFGSQNMIAPSHTGITMHNAGIRVHKATEEYMSNQRKIPERVEKDPYTGRTITYYRDRIPEGNTDKRLPKETLKQVGRRLVALQGYDHTRPKPTRREQVVDVFQPDASHQDAATYERRMGELEERARRDVQNNHDGDRPTWVRDTQRAFGYRGYHNMIRITPFIPDTMRRDTMNLPPTVDLSMNPNPANEIIARGIQRTAPRRPHFEREIHSAPFTMPVERLPVRGTPDSVGTHRPDTIVSGFEGPQSGPEIGSVQSRLVRQNTKRADQTTKGLEAPATGPSLGPKVGTSDLVQQHRADTELGVFEGPATFPVNMPPVLSAEIRNNTKRSDQNTQGFEGPVTGPSLPPLVGISDGVEQHRADTELSGFQGPATFPVHLPPIISADIRHNTLRDGQITAGFEAPISGPERGTVQSRLMRQNARREGITDVFTLGNAETVGGLAVRSAIRAPNRRKADFITREAGDLGIITDGAQTVGATTDFRSISTNRGRRFGEVTQEGLLTGAAIETLGASTRGSQADRLETTGKRAFTGANIIRSAGPGEGGAIGINLAQRTRVGFNSKTSRDSVVRDVSSFGFRGNGQVIAT